MSKQFFDATVKQTTWEKAKSGKLYLAVKCEVQIANGFTPVPTTIVGRIYATDATSKPTKNKDGEDGPSMLEKQLRAIGYSGPMNLAINIGTDVDLSGNKCRVSIEEYTSENGKVYPQIRGFYGNPAAQPADKKEIADIFSSLGLASDDDMFDDI